VRCGGPAGRLVGGARLGWARHGAHGCAVDGRPLRSAARLTSWVPWLCVPASRRVCPFRCLCLLRRGRHRPV